LIRIVFLQKDVFAKPAVMALSAVGKREGHDCRVVVADLEKDPLQAVAMLEPDVIAFSITTSEFSFMKGMGQKLREKCGDVKIICGGSHATFYPGVIHEDYLDAVCVGEGDQAFADYLNALDSKTATGDIPNFLVKEEGAVRRNEVRKLIEDLDGLPFYDRKIYSRYGLYSGKGREILYHQVVMAGRGCPRSCTFCFNKRYNLLYRGKGRIVRRRSVDHLMEELGGLKRSGQVRFITLDDDSFTLAPKEWLHRFCDAYAKEIGIPFKINSTPEVLDDDLVRRLKRAGCHAVKMGLESGNATIRNGILGKSLTEESLVTAAMLLRKHGIRFQTFNMVGCPGETLSMAFETYELNRRIRPDFVWCSLLNPYPGTDIHAYCLERKLLGESKDFVETGQSYFTDSPLNLPEKRELVNLQKLMNAAVQMNMPTRILKLLVKIPLNRFYRLIFGAGMTWGLSRVNKNSLGSIVHLSFRYLSRYNRDVEVKKP
jgi:radical SAM superfamily enzyme YgiQ (UPF0313 family)